MAFIGDFLFVKKRRGILQIRTGYVSFLLLEITITVNSHQTNLKVFPKM